MIDLTCHTCGKKYRVIPYRKDKSKYCSVECHYKAAKKRTPWNKGKKRSDETKKKVSISKKRWAATPEGREKIKKAVRASVKANAEKWKNGIHPLQDPKNRLKARKSCGKNSAGESYIEKQIGQLLDNMNLKKETQKPISYGIDVWGRPTYIFPDWFLSEYNLIIECDGKFWHQDKIREKERDAVFIKNGYRVLHLTGKEIRDDLEGCRIRIESLVNS